MTLVLLGISALFWRFIKKTEVIWALDALRTYISNKILLGFIFSNLPMIIAQLQTANPSVGCPGSHLGLATEAIVHQNIRFRIITSFRPEKGENGSYGGVPHTNCRNGVKFNSLTPTVSIG